MNWKPYEPFLHRAMGFLAMLTNTRLLLTRREMKQLPPENDDYPVMLIEGRVATPIENYKENLGVCRKIKGARLYWSEVRVMDTLNDSREYDEGGTVGWFVLVCASMLLGAMLHRWLD